MNYTKMDIVALRRLYEKNGKTEELNKLIKEVFNNYRAFGETFYDFIEGLVIPVDIINDTELAKILLENRNEPKKEIACVTLRRLLNVNREEAFLYVENGLADLDDLISVTELISTYFKIYERFNLSIEQKSEILSRMIEVFKKDAPFADSFCDFLKIAAECAENEKLMDNVFDLLKYDLLKKDNTNIIEGTINYLFDYVFRGAIDDYKLLGTISDKTGYELLRKILTNRLNSYIVKNRQRVLFGDLTDLMRQGVISSVIDVFRMWCLEKIKTGEILDIAKLDYLIGFNENQEEILDYFISIDNIELFELYKKYFKEKGFLIIDDIDNEHKRIVNALISNDRESASRELVPKKPSNPIYNGGSSKGKTFIK